MSTLELYAAGDLRLRLADDLRLLWAGRDWLGPLQFLRHCADGWATLADGAHGAAVPHPDAQSHGTDDLGEYERWSWDRRPVAAAVRAYRDRALMLFELCATAPVPPELATGRFESPSVSWPACDLQRRGSPGVPDGTASYAYQHAEFALPVFGDDRCDGYLFAPHRPPTVMPFCFIAPDGATIMIAPLDGFHEQIVAVPRDGESALRCGWHGDLSEVPAGFRTTLAIWAGSDVRQLLQQWGELLCARNATVRPGRYADALGSRLSYWTDNGAVYYYRTAPDYDYTETLGRAVDDLRRRDIAVGSVQIDSWFYPHELLRPVGPEGAPIVPPTGAMRWDPREDLFPDGFARLRGRLGDLPLAFHARHFSRKSPYWERYDAWVDGDYAHPKTADFYLMLLGQSVAWGAATYEQDWLVESFHGVRGLRQAPGRALAWQKAMDDAAIAHGLTLQWCMATPADFMESVALRNVTSIRTSGDYKYMFDNAFNWAWFLHTNALARALGLWPFKDVFISYGPEAGFGGEPYREVEALLAALSAGPVGIGDAVGASDRDLILRTCREDGLLVKPDVPIAALAGCFNANSLLRPSLLVGECYSDHPAGRWAYVAAFNAWQDRTQLDTTVALAALGESRPTADVVVYDWRRRTWLRRSADQEWPVALAYQEWDFRIVCPVLPGELTVFGDVSKYASVGDRRVAGIRSVDGGVAFTAHGVPGSVVTIQGWSATGLRGVHGWTPAQGLELMHDAEVDGWQWSESDGGWTVRVRIGGGGFTAVTLAV